MFLAEIVNISDANVCMGLKNKDDGSSLLYKLNLP